MKTAISIPDDTFEAAERLARQRGLSRSELYAAAVREYLHRNGDEILVDRINAACEALDTWPDPHFRALAARTLGPAQDW